MQFRSQASSCGHLAKGRGVKTPQPHCTLRVTRFTAASCSQLQTTSPLEPPNEGHRGTSRRNDQRRRSVSRPCANGSSLRKAPARGGIMDKTYGLTMQGATGLNFRVHTGLPASRMNLASTDWGRKFPHALDTAPLTTIYAYYIFTRQRDSAATLPSTHKLSALTAAASRP